MEEFSWRESSCKGLKIKVGVEEGKTFLVPDTWILEIDDHGKKTVVRNNSGYNPITGIVPIIKGISDYNHIDRTKKEKIKMPSRDKVIRLWLDIVTSAYNMDLSIHGNVAHIPHTAVDVKGMTVIPTEWPHPVQDNDKIILQEVANLYVHNYNDDNGIQKPMFRLSCYDTRTFGTVSAKQSKKYINLHPINDRDTIIELLNIASRIYSPDLTFGECFKEDGSLISPIKLYSI